MKIELDLTFNIKVGNDIRKAVADGWPIQSAIASDLRSGFWHCGHELFKTTPDTYRVPFIEGDAYDDSFLSPVPLRAPNSEVPIPDVALDKIKTLNELHHKVSAIHASAFFHLFPEERQLDLARRLVSLLLPKKGSIIFGEHVSLPEKGFRAQMTEMKAHDWRMFCHDPESWENMWVNEVFAGSGIEIKVDARLIPVQRRDLEALSQQYSQCTEELRFWIMRWSITIL
ncbi:hypothetical protein CVT24_004344 [Panaeolus cyanescens]|uniref:Methyltransferase domain-containing protein n=1 Tax=Panaeolus cyanescens TaxID=181874 RepID=A0A409X0F3_9AGAR|nr:hypothetical protein CVT24_004344 [Panaeolus cyanescens]